MPVRDVMERGVTVIGPDQTLVQAATLMVEQDVGFLPVCDGERIQGTLTDRDIVMRAVAHGRHPAHATVRDVMSDEVHHVFDDEDLERAAALMKAHDVRRLVVVDRDHKLVGVLSLGDLARASESASAEVLGDVTAAPLGR